MITTIETRLKINKEQEKIINDYIHSWITNYHKAWVLFNKKHLSESEIYHTLIKEKLTSNQVLSIINKVKTEHAKIKELTKTQLKQQISKIDNIKTFITKLNNSNIQLSKDILEFKSLLKFNNTKIKDIKSSLNTNNKDNSKQSILIKKLESQNNKIYIKLNKAITNLKSNKKLIYTKTIKLNRLLKLSSIKKIRIENNTFKLCFGSSNLFKQRPGSNSDKYRLTDNQKLYYKTDVQDNIIDWNYDLDLAKYNQILSIGDKKNPFGNAEIQYGFNSNQLKLRLTDEIAEYRLKIIATNIGTNFEELNDNKIIANGKYRMQARFITIDNVNFNHKLKPKLLSVINTQPITAKIIKKLTTKGKDNANKEIGYYLQLSFDENINNNELNNISSNKNLTNNQFNQFLLNNSLTLGIDLNVKGLAYCIVKSDGNKISNKELNKLLGNKDKNNILNSKQSKNLLDKNILKPQGFISWNLENKKSNQRKAIISQTINNILSVATSYGVKNIAIENLDFNNELNNMNSGFKVKTKNIKSNSNNKYKKSNKKEFNYNKMLSSLSQTMFKELLIRKCNRLNIIVKLVNPSYSSIGGYSKYGFNNKLKVDVSAALWLARQGIFGKCYKEEFNNSKIKDKNNPNNRVTVRFIKNYKEAVRFPYQIDLKQSKTINHDKMKWSHIALALGKSRLFWNDKIIEGLNPTIKQVYTLPVVGNLVEFNPLG